MYSSISILVSETLSGVTEIWWICSCFLHQWNPVTEFYVIWFTRLFPQKSLNNFVLVVVSKQNLENKKKEKKKTTVKVYINN